MPRVLPQRWTGHIAAVETLRDNYSEICKSLFEVAALSLKESPEAEGLLNRIMSFKFVFVVQCMCVILAHLKPLNSHFERITSDVATSRRLLAYTLMTFQSLRNEELCKKLEQDSNALINATELADQSDLYTSSLSKRQRRVPINLYRDNILFADANVLASTEEIYNNFQLLCEAIDATVAELNSRFTERNLGVVSAALCLLFKRTRTVRICKILASLLPGSSSLPISNIEAELMVLHNGVLKDDFLSLSDLSEHFSKHRSAFPSFAFVLDIALTLPVSTARPECCFSAVTQVLRSQRVSMGQSRMANLVLLAIHRDITSSLNLDSFVDLFALSSRKLYLK